MSVHIGRYGAECIACYKMLPQIGPPETAIWEFPAGDDSWAIETQEFVEDVRQKREPSPVSTATV